ncbi:hypothetical protein L2725_03245 [Shewanella corallii]|uniref:RPW8 domain-containing protein n=1 Tax=Shewanella corallii TaxID=560080 RepID=A0ABT0N2Y2_9GAMM|nr:hypothetical protein [Shewanella corallii]MCL2912808.1 hypothetical protein [Shewanella corallii]
MDIFDKVVAGVVAAVVGAFSAFVFGYLNGRIANKRSSIIKLEEHLTDILDELAKSTIEYWSVEQSKLDNPILIESNIKFLFRKLEPAYRSLSYRHGKISAGKHNKIKNNIGELYDIITGDDFEGARRKSNVRKITRSCGKISTLKLDIISIVHVD